MAILLNKVERGNPMNKTAPKKWYVVPRTVTQVKENEVAKQIADETTLNRKEAEMALSQFQKVLITNLLAGNSVQLGNWGSFHLTCNSEGIESKEKLTAVALKGLNIRFSPGKELKEALAKATFVFAEDLVKK
ncbi:MAG: HU family DNA-binding protein [Prevotellaceae bacterium]|jgi:predicted histone-like DNA-binding protein|nr:HU family DNA-binding protein [Prevotellaceae bacterium]